MRRLIMGVVNGALRSCGYELRKMHESWRFLSQINLGTVIDGRANVGGYAGTMRAHFPSAEIHAFEPNPKMFERINDRFAGDGKVTCYELALGDEDCTATFHLTQDSVSSSLLEEVDGALSGQSSAVTVSVIKLYT